MTNQKKHRLVILSGPSCAGKSPLAKALKLVLPFFGRDRFSLSFFITAGHRALGKPTASIMPSAGGRRLNHSASDDRYVVMDVRGDLQALDLPELAATLERGDVFFEGNPVVGRLLQTHPALEEMERLSLFMSPLSREEIVFLKGVRPAVSLPSLVTDIMRRRLLRRTRKQKGELSAADLENIERRASSAYREMLDAHYFRYVIPNHDGEDSENWDAFYFPLGDARKSLLAFVSALKGKTSDVLEVWDADLLPRQDD